MGWGFRRKGELFVARLDVAERTVEVVDDLADDGRVGAEVQRPGTAGLQLRVCVRRHLPASVDLAGLPGQPVYAPGGATVVFAGLLAGRPVLSLAHPGGLRTSYEPVEALVRPGGRVEVGTVIGRLLPGHPNCAAPACLHWGAMWGPAARADYVDPIGLLATTPVRLKPLAG